jgi:hypothetical protein
LVDSNYPKYGPVALISTLHEIYGCLISDHDWPAFATTLQQPPLATSQVSSFFRCKGSHHVKDCPKKGKSKDKSKEKEKEKNSDDPPAPKKAKTSHSSCLAIS